MILAEVAAPRPPPRLSLIIASYFPAHSPLSPPNVSNQVSDVITFHVGGSACQFDSSEKQGDVPSRRIVEK